jgi:hypothetical protein
MGKIYAYIRVGRNNQKGEIMNQSVYIENGNNLHVYHGDSLKVKYSLDPRVYQVEFDKLIGFFLSKVDWERSDEKVYGNVNVMRDRIFSTFQKQNRNLGVMFSGPKGLGKTLTIKKIIERATEKGYPVIIVNKKLFNLSDFFSRITQEAIIIFDEFEKKFFCDDNSEIGGRQEENNINQTEFLELFDGITAGKKLFIIACNDLKNISNYLLGRPGRIHYHWAFKSLSMSEIEEYCKDNLRPDRLGEIHSIYEISLKVNYFSYDILRSIIFELNNYDDSVKDVIKFLNIKDYEGKKYMFCLSFHDGRTLEVNIQMDLSDTMHVRHRLDDGSKEYVFEFRPSDFEYDCNKFQYYLDPKKLTNFKRYDNTKDEWLSAEDEIVDISDISVHPVYNLDQPLRW